MNSYEGAATLVMTDGTEALVKVNLQARKADAVSPREWGGTVDAARDALLLAEQSTFSLTLRLPDERTGQVMVTHVDVEDMDADGITWGTVAGVGDAPFGPR